MDQEAKNKGNCPADAKLVFKGSVFEIWQWEQKMFDGSVKTFECVKRPPSVFTIPTVGNKILVQVEEQPDRLESFISIPGGGSKSYEEAPLDAAKRELLEETGYASDDWVIFKEQESLSSKIMWATYIFVARNCKSNKKPEPEGGEKIYSKLISFDEFINLADNPKFRIIELIEPLLRMRVDPVMKENFRKLLFGN